MKRKWMLLTGCLLLACLTSCQGAKKTVAESCWDAAKEAQSLEEYVKEHGTEIDVEALKAEADSAESSLSQQFKATALLCGLEYRKNVESGGESASAPHTDLVKDSADAMFRLDYPVSGPYADRYLARAAEGETFWESLSGAFYPYDYFLPMFAAADHLDGQTLAALLSGIPADSKYGDKWKDAVDRWIRENPEKIVGTGDSLKEIGYFEDWGAEDWRETYFYDSVRPCLIRVDTAEDAVAYAGYLRASLLPTLESEFGREEFQKESEADGGSFYATKMTVTVDGTLDLKEPEEGGLPETIETEGKTVAAFYRNPQAEEFEGSPAPLRLLGDFMLNLPEAEFPASLAEADYYLVLTADYEYGDVYQNNSGKETKVRKVYSSTSVDLYDAGTGTFLRHLGNVLEQPQPSIFRDMADESAQYPELATADILSYIYHNVNEPDKYITLTDSVEGLESELQKDEPVVFGGLEITYHSGRAAKSFDEGMFRFTAKEGCQFVRGEFTIVNRGTETETFLPMVYSIAENPVVRVADSTRENFYDSVYALNDSRCLSGATLEPGESREGEVVFEVPDEVIQGEGPLYIAVSLGEQTVFYPLEF